MKKVINTLIFLFVSVYSHSLMASDHLLKITFINGKELNVFSNSKSVREAVKTKLNDAFADEFRKKSKWEPGYLY